MIDGIGTYRVMRLMKENFMMILKSQVDVDPEIRSRTQLTHPWQYLVSGSCTA